MPVLVIDGGHSDGLLLAHVRNDMVRTGSALSISEPNLKAHRLADHPSIGPDRIARYRLRSQPMPSCAPTVKVLLVATLDNGSKHPDWWFVVKP